MSRTDKDKPYWIAEKYLDNHHWRCVIGRIECDLPPGKPPRFDSGYWLKRYSSCYWEPVHDNPYRDWWQAPPPRWYRNNRWDGPERMRVRDGGRKAAAQYRGDPDSLIENWDFPNWQHRHNAAWDYW